MQNRERFELAFGVRFGLFASVAAIPSRKSAFACGPVCSQVAERNGSTVCLTDREAGVRGL